MNNRKTNIIISLFVLIFLFYFLINAFHFSHPFPKNNFYKIIWIEILLSILPYLFSRNLGRVLVILFSLNLIRIGGITGIQENLILNSGFFIGGTFGSIYYSIRNKESILKFNFSIFSLAALLSFFALERFLIYFNFPILNGFNLLETMYLENLSSKQAFAASIETIIALLFPLIYLLFEKIEDIKKEILIGFSITIFFNSIIIFIQRIEPSFLSVNTNLTLEVNRSAGLFRDSGSSSFILPVIFFTLLHFYKESILKRIEVKILLLIIALLLGTTQGRAYWIILIWGFIIFGFKNKLKETFFLLSIFIFALLIILLLFKDSSLKKSLFFLSNIDVLISDPTLFLMQIDTPRFYLNLMGIELFKLEPIFGHGMSSFIVSLHDNTLNLTNPKKIIDNPGSFYSGIFAETGILGVLFLLVNLTHLRFNFLYNSILLPGLLIGYQIAHPDSAALIIFILFGLNPNTHSIKNISNLIFLFFLLKLLYSFYIKEDIYDFRKNKISKQQLLAFQVSKNNAYHVFKGKIIWKVKNEKIKLKLFLDDSTSRKEIFLKITSLNSKKELSNSFYIKINKEFPTEININSENLILIEEINSDKSIKYIDNIPFCIPLTNFNEYNELI